MPSNQGEGFTLSVVAGNGQTGTVGEPLPDPLVVELRDSGGALVAGRQIAFVPQTAGDFSPDTVTTDAQGLARTRWVLGTATGSYSGIARLVAGSDSVAPVVPIAAAAVAGQPDTLRGVSGLVQTGRRGEALDAPLVVATVDRFGNPVPGVEVSWKVEDGGGDLSDRSTTTGPDGQASVRWTLGGRSGLQKVTARVGGVFGSPVTFIATVLF